jgi:hypothetical protein
MQFTFSKRSLNKHLIRKYVKYLWHILVYVWAYMKYYIETEKFDLNNDSHSFLYVNLS